MSKYDVNKFSQCGHPCGHLNWKYFVPMATQLNLVGFGVGGT